MKRQTDVRRGEDMVALMTMGCVLLPIVVVTAVLAWAESRARRGEATVAEPPLTSALLAARDDEGSGEEAAAVIPASQL